MKSSRGRATQKNPPQSKKANGLDALKSYNRQVQ